MELDLLAAAGNERTANGRAAECPIPASQKRFYRMMHGMVIVK